MRSAWGHVYDVTLYTGLTEAFVCCSTRRVDLPALTYAKAFMIRANPTQNLNL